MLAVLPFYYVYGLRSCRRPRRGRRDGRGREPLPVPQRRARYARGRALHRLRRRAVDVRDPRAPLEPRRARRRRALAALRWVTQAGGGMSPTLTRELLAMLPGRQVFVMYGATEASARLSYVPPDELPGCVGSIGRAIPDVELTVRRPDGTPCAVDEAGELFARGPNIMRGYWDDPDATARVLGPHGYRTGDLARPDGAGRLWLVGRARDMLKVGGHRVAARKESRTRSSSTRASTSAAVIGVPDELLGDRCAPSSSRTADGTPRRQRPRPVPQGAPAGLQDPRADRSARRLPRRERQNHEGGAAGRVIGGAAAPPSARWRRRRGRRPAPGGRPTSARSRGSRARRPRPAAGSRPRADPRRPRRATTAPRSAGADRAAARRRAGSGRRRG